MHFNPIGTLAMSPAAATVATPESPAPAAATPEASSASAAVRQTAPARAGAVPAGSPPAGALVEASQNLLKHIPGEASGFYLLAADSIKNPSLGDLGLIFALAFILLVVVRLLAKASLAVMLTTIVAFVLWMLIFDKGFLHVLLPNLLPAPMGLIVAVFYSMLITLLASAGKIR